MTKTSYSVIIIIVILIAVSFLNLNNKPSQPFNIHTISNSNNFSDGIRVGNNSDEPATETLSMITLGDLDNDTHNEAVAVLEWCLASCGRSIVLFKQRDNGIQMLNFKEADIVENKSQVVSLSIENRTITILRGPWNETGTTTMNYSVVFTNDNAFIKNLNP